jgi:hypothetical protein
MTTGWYYDEKGEFPHQQQLCKTVAWIKGCDLEGRQLISPTHLTAPIANPLTIRLLALRKALKQLKSRINTTRAKIKKQVEEQFAKHKSFGMQGTFKAEGSPADTLGAPIQTIQIGENKPFDFQHAMVHLALYEFFTNLGSILDRLALEINMLYELGIPKDKIDWGKLANKEANLTKLEGKDKNLSASLRDYIEKFKTAVRYRNRIVHDGMIKVEIDISIMGLSVNLAQDPDNETSPMNKDAVSFCEETKADILKLLDGSYELILQHIETQGKPPW